MSHLVLVHGIGMAGSSRVQMTSEWGHAVLEGLTNVRYQHAEQVTVECAFYGHLYNDGKALPDSPPYRPSDVTPGFEEELLLAIAGASGETAEGAEAAKVYAPARMQAVVARLERTGFSGWPEGRLIALVKQVNRFLEDSEFRERVRTEMSAAMATGPAVVVGHSLGSIVAYDWLARKRPTPVPHLVTLGSPLGFVGIRRRLGVRGFPAGVASWQNIAAREDAVACVKEISLFFDDRVEDIPCANSRREAHQIRRYLSNVAFSDVLVRHLG